MLDRSDSDAAMSIGNIINNAIRQMQGKAGKDAYDHSHEIRDTSLQQLGAPRMGRQFGPFGHKRLKSGGGAQDRSSSRPQSQRSSTRGASRRRLCRAREPSPCSCRIVLRLCARARVCWLLFGEHVPIAELFGTPPRSSSARGSSYDLSYRGGGDGSGGGERGSRGEVRQLGPRQLKQRLEQLCARAADARQKDTPAVASSLLLEALKLSPVRLRCTPTTTVPAPALPL
jgi:hypothetical protein